MIFGFVAKHRGIWPVAFLCEALGVSRSGFYAWLTRRPSARSRRDEMLSAKIRTSFQASDRTYGARRVWHDLLAAGIECGLHAIERLMRQGGLRARPRRRRLPIDLCDRPTAAVSANVLDRSFEAPAPKHGKPEVFNTDQGSQFTGTAFTGVLANNDIAISMDGKGAWRDNVFVERLWRSVKYEEVYLRAYDGVGEARTSIGRYLDFYNRRRPHSSLDGTTPDQAYFTPLPFRMAA
jgi:transposase InsO family protein